MESLSFEELQAQVNLVAPPVPEDQQSEVDYAFVAGLYSPGKTQTQLVQETLERFPNEDELSVASIVDRVLAEKSPTYNLADTQPKFGDFNGVLLNLTTDAGPICVDRNGVEIFTGVKYQLESEHRQKFVDVDAAQKQKNFTATIHKARYDFDGSKTVRAWDYDGLIARGTYCLWLGARKAEKSLFALRKAMHDACGKNWLNHRNLVGPVKVLYFDTENDKADVDDRYHEIITEFTEREQLLIKKNLEILLGKELRKQRINIEFNNAELWQHLQTNYKVHVIYLDCWYQLQSIKASDNESQKRALEMFEEYFPNTTLFLLHHTGRESPESLLRKSPAWLRVIGAERWSSKSSGGNVLTKKAELIICQEKFAERDAEGVEGDWFIDFQAYSRSSAGSILFSFEPVFGENIEGIDHEYKYRRKMVIKLSSLSARAAQKLRGKGPWPTKYAIAKDANMVGGRQYKAIEELIVKGFITFEDDKQYWLTSDLDEAIELSAENTVAVKTAATLLDELLLRPDGAPNNGVPFALIKSRADTDGINIVSLRKARERRKVTTVDRPDGPYWVAEPKKKTS